MPELETNYDPLSVEPQEGGDPIAVAHDGTKWVARGEGYDDHLAYQGHESQYAPVFLGLISAVPEEDWVLVVGAHVGTWAVRFAALRRVVALEANAKTCVTLLRNAELNGVADRIEVMNLAAWSEIGQRLSMTDPNGASEGGSNRVVGADPELAEVVTTTLDWVRHYRNRFGFVLMDVEGAESVVLAGAHDLLGMDRPYLSVELHEGHAGVLPDIRARVEEELRRHRYSWRSEIVKQEEHLVCWPEEKSDPSEPEFIPEGV